MGHNRDAPQPACLYDGHAVPDGVQVCHPALDVEASMWEAMQGSCARDAEGVRVCVRVYVCVPCHTMCAWCLCVRVCSCTGRAAQRVLVRRVV